MTLSPQSPRAIRIRETHNLTLRGISEAGILSWVDWAAFTGAVYPKKFLRRAPKADIADLVKRRHRLEKRRREDHTQVREY